MPADAALDRRAVLAEAARLLGAGRSREAAPLLERLDIHLEVNRVNLSEFDDLEIPTEKSSAIAARVSSAREVQLARQGTCNARLVDAQITRMCSLDADGRSILTRAMDKFGFSARTRQRILKVARTIADLAGEAMIGKAHIGEAITYRPLDMRELPKVEGAGLVAVRG